MNYACIDMEGVLIPEMWPFLAKKTGISDFMITTREVSDYERLMNYRIKLLQSNNIKLADVVELLKDLNPLEGAIEFILLLQQNFTVILVSDAFQEMVEKTWTQLGKPWLECHSFECDERGYIKKPKYRRTTGKIEVIRALQGNGVKILSVGDAFNDLEMLRASTRGLLFRPSKETKAAANGLPVLLSYKQIMIEAESFQN